MPATVQKMKERGPQRLTALYNLTAALNTAAVVLQLCTLLWMHVADVCCWVESYADSSPGPSSWLLHELALKTAIKCTAGQRHAGLHSWHMELMQTANTLSSLPTQEATLSYHS